MIYDQGQSREQTDKHFICSVFVCSFYLKRDIWTGVGWSLVWRDLTDRMTDASRRQILYFNYKNNLKTQQHTDWSVHSLLKYIYVHILVFQKSKLLKMTKGLLGVCICVLVCFMSNKKKNKQAAYPTKKNQSKNIEKNQLPKWHSLKKESPNWHHQRGCS